MNRLEGQGFNLLLYNTVFDLKVISLRFMLGIWESHLFWECKIIFVNLFLHWGQDEHSHSTDTGDYMKTTRVKWAHDSWAEKTRIVKWTLEDVWMFVFEISWQISLGDGRQSPTYVPSICAYTLDAILSSHFSLQICTELRF